MEKINVFRHAKIINDIDMLFFTYSKEYLYTIKGIQNLLLLEFGYKAPLYLLEKLIR